MVEMTQALEFSVVCYEQARLDRENLKVDIMYKALKCKFSIYPHLNSTLLSTSGSVLVEASPHDIFWGGGREGESMNYLGRLLMRLRSEFLGDIPSSGSSTVQAKREKRSKNLSGTWKNSNSSLRIL